MEFGLKSKVIELMITYHKYINNNSIITHLQYIERSCDTIKTIIIKINLCDSTNLNNNMSNNNNLLTLELLAETFTILPSTTRMKTKEVCTNSTLSLTTIKTTTVVRKNSTRMNNPKR